jgi:dolichol-phosphate mannosyltransferase
MKISIVIPCYNEAENISDAVNMVINGIDESVSSYEIILVDDGSTDDSRALISDILASIGKGGKIRAIHHTDNRGKGAALRSGIEQALMEWTLMMDADLQIDISELKSFLPYCAEYDFIKGVRVGRREGFIRTVVSITYNAVARLVIGSPVHDVGCPFKLVRTELAKEMPVSSDRFAVDAEMLLHAKRHGHRFREVDVTCQTRLKGTSSVKLRHVVQTFFEVITLKIRMNR